MTVNEITQRLTDHGFDTFLVGGAVRDILLGTNPKDVDIVTNARPEDIVNLFQDRNVNFVGKSFGVVIVDGVEVATYRFDVHDGIGDDNCSVEYADTIYEDLSRRDLTINAMAICSTSGDIVDEHNGREDLRRRIIRFVGNPDQRIQEDPNRIIRACRFLAKIEGEFSTETLRALRRNAHLVDTHVARERIRIEILKAMEANHPSLFFAALETIGVLELILPELHRAVDHSHGKYHIETVFEHQMIAGDSSSASDPVLRLASFLHDYGKPEAFQRNINDPNENFIGHEVIGEELLQRDLGRLRFSAEEVDRISGVCRVHMNTLKDITPRAMRRLLKRLHDRGISWRDFVRVRIADRAGNLAHEPFPLRQWVEWVRLFNDPNCNVGVPFNTHSLALTGGDLISELGLRPGPIVGRIQRELLERVIEDGPELNTREELLRIARELLPFLED